MERWCIPLVVVLLVTSGAPPVTSALTADAYSLTPHFSVLSASLATFEAGACQGSDANLQCPRDTAIKLVAAAYVTSARPRRLCASLRTPSRRLSRRKMCREADALEEARNTCEGKKSCSLPVAPPPQPRRKCQGTQALAVRYKCEPREYEKRVVCGEGTSESVSCGAPGLRIAVHSAVFGYTVAAERHCKLLGTGLHECVSSNATLILVQRCQGKRRCALEASPRVFGRPCPDSTPSTLTLQYKCIDKGLLASKTREDSTSPVAPVSPSHDDEPSRRPTEEGSSVRWEEVKAGEDTSPPPPDTHHSSYASSWMSLWQFFSQNKEKAVLYTLVCVSVGVILVLLILVARLSCCRRDPHRPRPLPKHTSVGPESVSTAAVGDELPVVGERGPLLLPHEQNVLDLTATSNRSYSGNNLPHLTVRPAHTYFHPHLNPNSSSGSTGSPPFPLNLPTSMQQAPQQQQQRPNIAVPGREAVPRSHQGPPPHSQGPPQYTRPRAPPIIHNLEDFDNLDMLDGNQRESRPSLSSSLSRPVHGHQPLRPSNPLYTNHFR